MVYYSRLRFSYFKGTLEVGTNIVHELEPHWEVDPKKLNLWGGLKNKWTSFLESTFILWITSPKRRFFSPKKIWWKLSTRKRGGSP